MVNIRNIAFAVSALIGSSQAGDGSYNYITNGADWPSNSPDCGLTNQSPIDLKTEEGAYPTHSYVDDDFNKIYTNQVQGSDATGIKIEWKSGHTTQVAVNKAGQDTQTFHSKLADTVYGSTSRYTGVQFHFHAGSEHTIDGKRHDLEMHTVHLASEEKNGFKYAAMGLMFSVQDFDRSVPQDLRNVIDGFFESMKWENKDGSGAFADPLVAEVPYGDLMMAVSMHDRWVYKGSVTTPPCAQSVYWNVLKTVFPISAKHLHQFKVQLARGENDLAKTGNWRVTGEVDDHNVIVVSTKTGNGTVNFLGIVLFILVALAVSLMATLYMNVYTQKDHTTDFEMINQATGRGTDKQGFSEGPTTARSHADEGAITKSNQA